MCLKLDPATQLCEQRGMRTRSQTIHKSHRHDKQNVLKSVVLFIRLPMRLRCHVLFFPCLSCLRIPSFFVPEFVLYCTFPFLHCLLGSVPYSLNYVAIYCPNFLPFCLLSFLFTPLFYTSFLTSISCFCTILPLLSMFLFFFCLFVIRTCSYSFPLPVSSFLCLMFPCQIPSLSLCLLLSLP